MTLAASAPGRVPKGLLTMVGMVVLLESLAAHHDLEFINSWGCDWQFTRRMSTREASRCEILCFGDSLVKYAVLPKVLEGQLRRRSYNLALSSGSPPASLFLLRRALDAGARPRALLVDFAPHTLAFGPQGNEQLWPELVSLGDSLELGWRARDARLFGSIEAARLLTTLKNRHEIRNWILECLKGNPDYGWKRWIFLSSYKRNWKVNRGANVVARNASFHGDPDFLPEALSPNTWCCTPENRSYLHSFFALAAARQIPVFWLIPPFSPEIQDRRERKGLDALYSQLARSIQVQFPNVIVLDARRSGYDQAVHVDPLHLDRQGAVVLSQQIADIMADHLDGRQPVASWTILPVYRERPIDVLVEDVDESATAIAARLAESSLRR